MVRNGNDAYVLFVTLWDKCKSFFDKTKFLHIFFKFYFHILYFESYNDEIHMHFTRRVIFEKTSRTIGKLKQPRKKLL